MPDIIIKGQTWNTVPAVDFKTPGSGTLTGATYYWTGDSDVTPQDVVQGKTFYNISGKTIGSLSVSAGDIRYGSTITGVTGTFSGSNTIEGSGGETPTAATPGDILAGHAAFLDGQQVTGEMPINYDYYTQITPGGSNQVTLQEGYYSSATVAVAADSYTIPIYPSTSMQTLTANDYYWTSVEVLPAQSIYDGAPVDIATPSDVVQGKWFLSQNGLEEGSYTPSSSVTYTVTDATAGDVISGKSFYKATSTTTATLVVGSYTPPTGGFNIDLTGTTWVLNSSPTEGSLADGTHSFNINYNFDGLTINSATPTLTTFDLSLSHYGPSGTEYLSIDLTGTCSSIQGADPSDVSPSEYYTNTQSFAWDSKTGYTSDEVYFYSNNASAPFSDWTFTNKTMSITGGTDASNPALVAWLLTNATKQ